ncbi:MAG TPA: hypothetical protein VIL84_13245 [Devosiaceae bacterium]
MSEIRTTNTDSGDDHAPARLPEGLAEDVGLAERHVSRQLRLAYLAPEVLKRLTCGREASAVSLYDLYFLAGETWQEQAERAFL